MMSTDSKTLLGQLENTEKEISQLEEEFELLMKRSREDSGNPETDKLKEENAKLRYRIIHLEKAIKEEKGKASGHAVQGSCKSILSKSSIESGSLLAILKYIFEVAIRSLYPQLTSDADLVALTPSTKPEFGDYQCNSAMNLSKLLKLQGVNSNPRDIATNITKQVKTVSTLDKEGTVCCNGGDTNEVPLIISHLEVAGAGFINIFLHHVYVIDCLKKIVLEGVKPRGGLCWKSGPNGEKVQKQLVIDYSSPNIAKEMHVGHLRSTIIGDGIARLFRFLGYKVLGLNHVGDWGTQFGMLITHLKDKYPNYKVESPPINQLQAFYKESKKRFDEDPEFKSRAMLAVVNLQNYDEDHLVAWRLICDVSRREFQKIYDRLGIKDLHERGESFYQSRMTKIIEELKQRNLLVLEEGRWLMFPPEASIPLTLVKSDGGYTYATSDMTAVKQRLQEERADIIIYVVDSGQCTHFDCLFKGAKMAGYIDPSKHRVEHISFGVVLGEDRTKFKTRSGDTVRLSDLLDEGLQRTAARLAEKGRDSELTPNELKSAQEAIAYSCIKYADLSHNRTNDYVFSFDKMLEDKGNTAVYLLYAYTRIRSISRNANITKQDFRTALIADPHLLTLDHEKEWKLGKTLMRFPDILLQIHEDLLLHKLCEYLYELSTTFTEFYDVCYCIEKQKETGEIKKIHMNRLMLCEITAEIMATGFQILGLNTVEKM